MNIPYWLNTAWMISCAREARRFHRAVTNVRRTQENRLLQILRANQQTWYGRRYRFDTIRSTEEYQRRVPLTDIESLSEPLHRVFTGEQHVLTAEPVILLEPTGGSTTGEKLIPYTETLRREFQRAIAVWIHDVMRNIPAARRGRAYWSISPMAQPPRHSPAGIPIGFDDDRDYLGSWQRWAVSQLLVVPPRVRDLQSFENACYVTLLYLLRCSDLALISIWSPTFLSALLAKLPEHMESICADVRDGCVRLPQPGKERSTAFSFRPSIDRAAQLRHSFANSATTAEMLGNCWPQLALISCWADAASAMYVPRLRETFPNATLQPKGLLATEGIISFPLLSAEGNVIAVRSHFLEFSEATSHDRQCSADLRLADELQLHQRYRVFITTGGGLYRYDLGDEIQVTGFFDGCPLVRFVGRTHATSDLVGEKLSEEHVLRAVESACRELDIGVNFALLAPTGETPARYRLYLECQRSADPVGLRRQLSRELEERLKQNPHYRIAVSLGQLREADVRMIDKGGWEKYQKIREMQGQRIGDVKPAALDSWPGWGDVFAADRNRDRAITDEPGES